MRDRHVERVQALLRDGQVEDARSVQNAQVRKELARRKEGKRVNVRGLKVAKAAIDLADKAPS